MAETPTFASVARKIGNLQLEGVLKELADNVMSEIAFANSALRRAEVRHEIKQLKAETRRFEIALNRVSKCLLDLPSNADECLLIARQATRASFALCEKTLSIASGKGGRPKKPGRVTCALIVIEAWACAKGKNPGANNETVQEICNDYWLACGGEPITGDDPAANWRRSMIDALSKNGALRRYIQDEFWRSTK
jgi:hypothetical protein